MKGNYEELEQTDFVEGDYIEKVVNKYSQAIGLFLIEFSCLEHELNIAIAEFIHDDAHEMGYMIIERLTTDNKIDLFFKMCLRMATETSEKKLKIVIEIKDELKSINSFRNSLVHANWQTLNKDKTVRTRIVVDNQNGYVKFKRVEMTIKLIRSKTREIYKLLNEIEKYKESASLD